MNKLISAIVVIYNPNFDQVEYFLKSILKQIDLLVLVDNSNTDSHLYQLHSFLMKNKKIKYINMNGNKGLASAQNKGFEYLRKEKINTVFLFDQDSFVEENYCNSMIKLYSTIKDKTERILVLGPKFIDLKNNTVFNYGNLKWIRTKPVNFSMEYAEVDMVIASGSLIDIENLFKVGLMREDFFIDCIDTEWCLRGREKGYSSFLARDIYMEHNLGDEIFMYKNKPVSLHSLSRLYYLIRNNFYLFLWSSFSINRRIKFLLSTIKYIMIYKSVYPKKIIAKTSILALFHAFKKNMGGFVMELK